MVAHKRPQLPSSRFPTLPVGIFIVALAIRLIGILHVDNTWDEHFYYDAARTYLKNWAQLDFSRDAWRVNFEHPPLGKYVYFPAITYNKLRYGDLVPDTHAYDAGRVSAAIIGSLTALVVYFIGRRLLSPGVALIGTLFYLLLPAVIGYDRVLGLTAPFGLVASLSVLFLLRGIQKDSHLDYLASGIFGGAAFATRFNGILLLVLLMGGYLIFRSDEWWKQWKVTIPFSLLAAPLLFGLFLFISWPWLWSGGLGHLVETFVHWGGTVSDVWFGRDQEVPIYYFIFYFLISTPGLLVFLMLPSLWKTWRTRSKERLFLWLYLLVPFLVSFFHLRQDGPRYVLWAYPALALLAADGLIFLTSRLRQPLARASLIALVTMYLLVTAAVVHPYYLDYYNEFVGLPRTVVTKGWFELGSQGTGIREATEYINRIAPPRSTVHFEIIPDDNPFLDREGKELVRLDQPGADYLVVNTRAKRVRPEKIDLTGYKEVYAVKAMGAPFVWVYERQK